MDNCDVHTCRNVGKLLQSKKNQKKDGEKVYPYRESSFDVLPVVLEILSKA